MLGVVNGCLRVRRNKEDRSNAVLISRTNTFPSRGTGSQLLQACLSDGNDRPPNWNEELLGYLGRGAERSHSAATNWLACLLRTVAEWTKAVEND